MMKKWRGTLKDWKIEINRERWTSTVEGWTCTVEASEGYWATGWGLNFAHAIGDAFRRAGGTPPAFCWGELVSLIQPIE